MGPFAGFFVLRFPRKNSCPKYKNNIFSYQREEEESVIFNYFFFQLRVGF
jgi:hypothetical protein